MKKNGYPSFLAVMSLLLLAACKTTPQMTSRPDFLSTYDHLQKVDTGVWRYTSPPLLANCNKFIVSPVKVLFNEFDGKPITPEQRQRTADFVHQAIAWKIAERYPVVTEPGPDVAEVRVALTEGYRTGSKLGLCVQGEILDNSKTQVAAVVRTELSQHYIPDWETKDTAKKMVDEWAQRLRAILDEAHNK
jgi:hypothetical protein